jgi:hypothetical protein
MSAWIPTTLAIAVTVVTATTAAHGGPCIPKKSYHCTDSGPGIDLNSVPDIANQIVRQEPIAQKRKDAAIEPAATATYTGPIVGVTEGKRRPTVGYSWSLQ